MGCCVHHKPESLNLELIIKSEPRPCVQLPTDGFCDVSLESQRSQVLDEVPSPLPSFSFLSADKATRYFIDKVTQRSNEDTSINRSMMTETKEEGTTSAGLWGPGHGRNKSADCAGLCKGLELRSRGTESGGETQTMRIVRANLRCCQ